MNTIQKPQVKETVDELLRVALKGAALGATKEPGELIRQAIRTLYPNARTAVVEHAVLCNSARERLDKQERAAMANEEAFVRVGQLHFDDFDIPEHTYPPLLARQKSAEQMHEWYETREVQSGADVQELERHLSAARRRNDKDKAGVIASGRICLLLRDNGYDPSVMTYEQAIEKAQEIASGVAVVSIP